MDRLVDRPVPRARARTRVHALGLHHHGRRGCVAEEGVTAAKPCRSERRVVGRGYARH